MKIEIVEFYTFEKDDKKKFLSGSLHIYLIDFHMDIRGIYVTKEKGKWFFKFPDKKEIDPCTKKIVRFPVFSFTEFSKMQEYKKLVIKLGKEYIIEKFPNLTPKKINKKFYSKRALFKEL
jgi:hypothetical protein